MNYRKQFYVLFSFSLLHIACSSSCPPDAYGCGVTRREKNQIVAKHNQLRKLIKDGKVPNQPKGTNLKTMKWDESLAKAAQDIANTCVFEHKEVHDERFSVGQNLYTFSSTLLMKPRWNEAIQNWFDEHKMYKYPQSQVPGVGHYTQIVWADTYLVGCGYTNYPNRKRGLPYVQLYVCNYGPAGNYPTAPYKTE